MSKRGRNASGVGTDTSGPTQARGTHDLPTGDGT
jgi:hypothetical protein